MRILKFRAWDAVKKIFPPSFIGFHIIGEVTVFDLIKQYKLEELNDLTITQFTGLLDNNKKEIYEGDIVEMVVDHYGLKLMGEVIFSYGEFIVRFNHYSPIGFWHLGRQKSVIVKGNTFENPELLNKYESTD